MPGCRPVGEPLPESPTPPKGTSASSFTVSSLMCRPRRRARARKLDRRVSVTLGASDRVGVGSPAPSPPKPHPASIPSVMSAAATTAHSHGSASRHAGDLAAQHDKRAVDGPGGTDVDLGAPIVHSRAGSDGSRFACGCAGACAAVQSTVSARRSCQRSPRKKARYSHGPHQCRRGSSGLRSRAVSCPRLPRGSARRCGGLPCRRR